MTNKIGFMVGSLRKDSWNKKVAEVVKCLFPEDFAITFLEIGDLPYYIEDYDQDSSRLPDSYRRFRKEAKEQDGYIFFTPEYNRQIPPALKNALDVGSRAKGTFNGKPAAVVSASLGAQGGALANFAVRQTLVYLDLIPLQMPEVYLSSVQNYFNEDGSMKEYTKEFLQKFVDAYIAHFHKIAGK